MKEAVFLGAKWIVTGWLEAQHVRTTSNEYTYSGKALGNAAYAQSVVLCLPNDWP